MCPEAMLNSTALENHTVHTVDAYLKNTDLNENSRQAPPKDTVLHNTEWPENKWKGLVQSYLLNLYTIHNLVLLVYILHMIWHLLLNIYFHLSGEKNTPLYLKFKRENNEKSGSQWQIMQYIRMLNMTTMNLVTKLIHIAPRKGDSESLDTEPYKGIFILFSIAKTRYR